jgi:type II secretory pathway component PulJ
VLEALVSMLLGSALLLGLHVFSQAQLKSMQNQATQISVQSVARSMVELIARDLRRSGMDPTCAKAFSALSVAKSDEVRVKSDLDASGFIDAPEEDVSYRYDYATNSVERISGGISSELLDGITFSGSRLRYFDGAGAELVPNASGLDATDRGQVRRIRIEIALADSADPERRQQARVATDVDLRNRYFLATTECP